MCACINLLDLVLAWRTCDSARIENANQALLAARVRRSSGRQHRVGQALQCCSLCIVYRRCTTVSTLLYAKLAGLPICACACVPTECCADGECCSFAVRWDACLRVLCSLQMSHTALATALASADKSCQNGVATRAALQLQPIHVVVTADPTLCLNECKPQPANAADSSAILSELHVSGKSLTQTGRALPMGSDQKHSDGPDTSQGSARPRLDAQQSVALLGMPTVACPISAVAECHSCLLQLCCLQ